MFGQERTSDRVVTQRQEYQSSRPYQRENATFKSDIDRREPALALLSGVELGGKKILADRA